MPGNTNIGYLRFLESLNDFLPESKSRKRRRISFNLRPSVKDLIEAQGVPHVEIFGLKVNNEWQDLSYNLQHNDEVTVFPKESVPNSDKHYALKPVGQLPNQFIADVHLGKMVRHLRLMGVDTLYDKELEDKEIITLAEKQERAVLSRDIGMLKHSILTHGYWLRSTDPDQQIVEVLSYFDLRTGLEPFSRCLMCNGLLEDADPEEGQEMVPEGVKSRNMEYSRCQKCGKIYWKGSHYKNLSERVKSIRARLKKEEGAS